MGEIVYICSPRSKPRRELAQEIRMATTQDTAQSAAERAQLSIAARQVPPPGRLYLDHIAHFVPDMQAAAAVLEALGFKLTPWCPQTQRDAAGAILPAGSGNRCVMLESGYLEFLTPTHDTAIGLQMQAAIARHTGLHLLAFGTPAAEEEHARLARHGFAPLPLVPLQRDVEVDDGQTLETRTARFSVARVPPEAMPEGRIQFARHHTPECLWQPRYMKHENSVIGLHAAFVVAEDPIEVGARYARFSALLPRTVRGFVQLHTARGEVFVGSATACKSLFGSDVPEAPSLAGYALTCVDPDSLRERLLAAGCIVHSPSPGLHAAALPPAIGSAILFGTLAALQDWLSPGCG